MTPFSSPPFSGYCEFWGAVAHCPQMYYSFDVGEWHIVSLDSVTFAQGGEKAATPTHLAQGRSCRPSPETGFSPTGTILYSPEPDTAVLPK